MVASEDRKLMQFRIAPEVREDFYVLKRLMSQRLGVRVSSNQAFAILIKELKDRMDAEEERE